MYIFKTQYFHFLFLFRKKLRYALINIDLCVHHICGYTSIRYLRGLTFLFN